MINRVEFGLNLRPKTAFLPCEKAGLTLNPGKILFEYKSTDCLGPTPEVSVAQIGGRLCAHGRWRSTDAPMRKTVKSSKR